MTQTQDNWVTAQNMVRSRAWRYGYEDFRLGAPFAFSGHRSKALAYEYGRLTAAFLRSRGERLMRLSTKRPLATIYVPQLAKALMECMNAKPADWATSHVLRDEVQKNTPGAIRSVAYMRDGQCRLLNDH